MSRFSRKSITLPFLGRVSNGLSQADAPIVFLGFVTSPAFPGPPAAPAIHKHYK